MNDSQGAQTLGMREMSARSGVGEGTLRVWEARHAFPVPARLPSGHRRYSELDLMRVRAVVDARKHGLPLRMAIDRARRLGAEPRRSVYAALRESFPQLQPQPLSKRALVCLSRAIEDEACIRAERPLWFGCFQRERYYRQVQPRWAELARTSARSIVLSDFRRQRRPAGGPAEVPLFPSDPVMREWVIVCEGATFAVCLAGCERPSNYTAQRMFETIWTVEEAAVREAARVCSELAGRVAPELVEGIHESLREPPPSPRDELRIALALSSRMVLYATAQPT